MTNPKRPRDPNQLAKLIVDIATGETSDAKDVKSRAAEMGRIGGIKRAKRLAPERRQEIAKHAAEARWKATADGE